MACALCQSESELTLVIPQPAPAGADGAELCGLCRDQLTPDAILDAQHLRCLQDAAWSQEPAVQVLSIRLLRRIDQPWATDLLGMLYVDEATQAWADDEEEVIQVLDCNGATLVSGDSVTIIKDLPVRGSSLVAKRGTTVRRIRVGSDPTHVEGRVEGQAIKLKTCFLRKV